MRDCNIKRFSFETRIGRSKMKYGFITYARPCDAYTAIDDSSKNAAICHYDISFGGRRTFCREQYFDLGEFILNGSIFNREIVNICKKRLLTGFFSLFLFFFRVPQIIQSIQHILKKYPLHRVHQFCLMIMMLKMNLRCCCAK